MSIKNISIQEGSSVNISGAKEMIGFRCSQELKHRLASQAIKSGKPLARYIEDTLNRVESDDEIPVNDNSTPDFMLQQRNAELTAELNSYKKKYDLLLAKTAVFNHPKLLELYNSVKGRTWGYVDESGRKVAMQINEPTDILTVLVQVFKPAI